MAVLPQPVIDATGLTGTFDLSLEWAPETAPNAPEIPGPTFQEALKTQLGLKLSSRKAPIDLLVIDHIEQPSAN